LAIMAFVIRQKQRFLYGLIELIAGLSAIMFTLIEVDIIEKLNLSFFLKILGGLYLTIRSFDNIIIGLRGTRFGAVIESKLLN
ncbi:MAG: hypothetical protein KDD09_26395, partial [Phaeodactylibacter sp.]|nr:hypothetical protein [Phaeodactylibacter sp.]